MGLVYIENSGFYRFGIWKMDEDPISLHADSFGNAVPEFNASHRKLEFISVRRLAQAMGVDPLSISYTVSGKPFLRDLPETYISITHSRHYAAFMLSDHPQIGIDMEEYSERIFKIRSRFMREEEELSLKTLISKQAYSKKTELIALYLHWCAKEAMFKALDLQGIDFKQDLGLDTREDWDLQKNLQIRGRLTACYFPQQFKFNINYNIQDDYILTCCSSV